MEKAICRFENVTKKYGSHYILKELSFSLHKDECTAIIGKNGTGKSTLLKLMAGFILPTKGKIIFESSVSIGYVPEQFPVNSKFTPFEYLSYLGRIQGLEKVYLEARIHELLERFSLMEKRDTRINSLSKGMKQKIGIAQAILNEPELLLLDEPLSGLDAAAQNDLIHIINDLKGPKVAVVFTCHEQLLLDEAADRLIAIESNGIKSDILLETISEELKPAIIRYSYAGSRLDGHDAGWKGMLEKRELGTGRAEALVDRRYINQVLKRLIEMNCTILSVQNEES